MAKHYTGELNPSAPAIAVIMAGGQGTRFWPLSRHATPKQFMVLPDSGRSLIQETSERLLPLTSSAGILVVTNEATSPLVREHLPTAAILSEPVGRNTAPCIAYAAMQVLEAVGDVPMICSPADHVIANQSIWEQTLRQAIEVATQEQALVTLGIRPTRPETGYGYIQLGGERSSHGSLHTNFVSRFVEKPDVKTAEQYLASGNFCWNSGVFVWKPSVLLAAMSKYLPELTQKIESVVRVSISDRQRIAAEFQAISAISIDVGVLEKADNVLVVSGADFGWSDIGSWQSWSDYLAARSGDAFGNLVFGDVLMNQSEGTSVIGGKRLIACSGVKDLVIVDTEDALLVCHKDSAQAVRLLVEELQLKKRYELL